MTHNPFRDFIHSILLWRIWIRLGMRDVRLRFRRSSIGIMWIFLNLSITVLAVGFIYGTLFRQEIKNFLPLLTVSIVFWTYLTSSIVGGGNAFIASEGYIKQIGLPIYVYVFRFFVNTLLTALISLIAYVVIVLAYQVRIGLGILWFIPGLVLLALISLLTITIFAFLNARFRDVSHMATSLMQVLFYLTPVIWPADLLRERGLGSIIDWNPFYHILEIVRQPLLSSRSAALANYLVVGLVILIMGGLAAWLIQFYHRRIVFFL